MTGTSTLSTVDPKEVAICVVHGQAGRFDERAALRYAWPRLQLEQIRKHTPPGFTVYAFGYCYNNRFLPEDRLFLEAQPEVRFIPADDIRHGHYPFVWPIFNWLVRQAARTHRVIVHFDLDAFPVADDWLNHCLGTLNDAQPLTALALGEWGRRQAGPIFAAFTREGLTRHGFDFSPVGVEDVGARLSTAVEQDGLTWRAMRRSNRVSYDPFAAGLYDDRLYHHGVHPHPRGGQIPPPKERPPEDPERAARLAWLTHRLFDDTDRFLQELRGEAPPAEAEVEARSWTEPPYSVRFHPAVRLLCRAYRRGGWPKCRRNALEK